jgi:hypothetical protein
MDTMSIAEFCRRHNISRATYANLQIIHRGPEVIRLGGRVLISLEAAAVWRERMSKEPIIGGIRRLAEQARGSSEVA